MPGLRLFRTLAKNRSRHCCLAGRVQLSFSADVEPGDDLEVRFGHARRPGDFPDGDRLRVVPAAAKHADGGLNTDPSHVVQRCARLQQGLFGDDEPAGDSVWLDNLIRLTEY